MLVQRHFTSAEDLARNLAVHVAATLRQVVSAKGKAVLAVSGGSTPVLFFKRLSVQKLPWANVSVTLVDERQVAETSSRSNAKLVKENLLQNEAVAANFIGLFENAFASACPDFDLCILGMGNDGHTASFFPGGDTLAEALSAAAPDVLALSAPGSGEARLTFGLPKILRSHEIILHIQGTDKLATLAKALEPGADVAMPVRAVLRQAVCVEVYACS